MRLLTALWPSPPDAALTFWFAPSKTSVHIPLRDIYRLDEDDHEELRQRKQHVYFGLGARVLGLPESRQGGKNDVTWLPGFAIDIDIFDPIAHKAQNLPQTLEEATALFGYGPAPSAIVHTGNGIQGYFFFEEAVPLADESRRRQVQQAFADFQKPIIEAAKEKGQHVDSTATNQRVWRLPGFENLKTGRMATLIHCDESCRYTLSDLGVALPKPRKNKEPPKTAEPGATARGVLKTVRERLGCITKHDNAAFESIQKLLRGESFAEPGERENTVQRIASTIAWMPEGRDADPTTLAEMFRPGFTLWAAEDGAKLSVGEELKRAADKVRRSQRDYYDKQEAQRDQFESLAKFARRESSEDPVPLRDLRQCAIVAIPPSYYAFDWERNEYFSRPLRREELAAFVRDAWKGAPEGISTTYVTEKSEVKVKTDTRLVQEYGINALLVIGDLALEKSYYDLDEKIFYEAVTKRRALPPERSFEIEEWLQIFCGDAYDRVCDWMAGLLYLSHQHCGLYIEGAKEVGKSLFAQGLARLFRRGGPTPLGKLLGERGDFNAEIVQCPLLWVDEGFTHRRAQSAALRRMIGETSFHLHQKYQTPRLVRGCPRILITANNPDVLNFGAEELCVEDVRAIASRFLHVKVNEAAADWIRARNAGRQMTDRWVEGDEMAKHCLYLAKTRTLDLSKRFLVEGLETEMHRNFLIQSDTDNAVIEWVVRFATNPKRVLDTYRAAKKLPRAIIGMGELLVNAQAVIDHWEEFMKSRAPSTRQIGLALSKIARRTFRLQRNGERVQFRSLGLDFVLQWCKAQGVGDESKIRTNLDQDLDFLAGTEVEEDAA